MRKWNLKSFCWWTAVWHSLRHVWNVCVSVCQLWCHSSSSLCNKSLCLWMFAVSGIGRATALALARCGAKVTAVTRTQADLNTLVQEVHPLHTTTHTPPYTHHHTHPHHRHGHLSEGPLTLTCDPSTPSSVSSVPLCSHSIAPFIII